MRALASLAMIVSALAGAQQTQWKSPVDIGRIEISPDGQYAFISDWADGNYFVNLKSGHWTPCATRILQFSADGKYAAGVSSKNGESDRLNVFDLSTNKQILALRGSACFFAPTGHTLAVQSESEIDLYDLPKQEWAKKLQRFNEDIKMNAHGAMPISIRMTGWKSDGIEVAANTGAGSDPQFYIDPERDQAAQGHYDSYVYGVRLLDGSLAHATTNSDANPAMIATLLGHREDRVLFHASDAGPEFARVSDNLKLAASANVLVANALSRNQSVAAIWGINAVNGRSDLILKKPWPHQPAGLGYISLAVWPDGKWILYRDFNDPKQLDRVPVPKNVYDMSPAGEVTAFLSSRRRRDLTGIVSCLYEQESTTVRSLVPRDDKKKSPASWRGWGIVLRSEIRDPRSEIQSPFLATKSQISASRQA